ncbi:hypothetical protein BH10PAT1_BH10PAT1_7690 [soil metagenome]
MTEQKETQKEKNLRQETVSQILTLLTASFGLVAALAWNQFVTQLIQESIKPLLGANSGVITSLVYAIIVTILAVVITIFITRFLKRD